MPPGTVEPVELKTRSEAWDLGDGTSIVKLEGKAGGVDLRHLEVLPESKEVILDERIKTIVLDFAPRLLDLTLDERLTILIPMIIAQVRTSPNAIQVWGRILSLMLEKEPDQVVILCSNLVAQVARKHGVMPSLDRTVDVAEGLEAQILAGLERAARAAD
jgi:hypothetical protein